MNLLDAIRTRRSVRTYADRSLSPDLKRKVEDILRSQGEGYFGNRARFALVERDETRRQEKVRLGTYGFIKGAPCFIAGALARRTLAEVDFGLLMERVVLHMTRLGLGTCWIGGTFNRDEYARLLHLDEESWVPCVLALGHPAEGRGTVERVIRWGAKADTRLPWETLFFSGDFSTPLSREKAGVYADILDAVRIGPSASNKQPWRAVLDEHGLHLFLLRTLGYKKWVPTTDLQQIDMGIAMCHVEESAAALGLVGHWERMEPNITLPGEGEYVVTWVLKSEG